MTTRDAGLVEGFLYWVGSGSQTGLQRGSQVILRVYLDGGAGTKALVIFCRQRWQVAVRSTSELFPEKTNEQWRGREKGVRRAGASFVKRRRRRSHEKQRACNGQSLQKNQCQVYGEARGCGRGIVARVCGGGRVKGSMMACILKIEEKIDGSRRTGRDQGELKKRPFD